MRNIPPALALRQARTHLIEHGHPPAGALREGLARSWQRSHAAGLLPTGRLCDPVHADAQALRQALARNHELLAHSRPVMEYLFDQVRHSQSVVILADSRGTLMHTLGDAFFLSKAERVALSCGASWHEAHRGTNAIGTALAETRGVEIHGAEHYLERNGFLTCAAAPILSGCGTLMGVLDISGDQHNGHPHTLGLVETAARMIENRLLLALHRRHTLLHLHPHAEGIGTVAEGMVVVSDDGLITGANRAGLALLRLTYADLGTAGLAHVLDTRLDDLLACEARRPQQPVQVRRHDGTVLYAQLSAQAAQAGPRPVFRPERTAQATATAAGMPPDALAALDTGDLRWRTAADKARRVLDKPIPILIQGESGVGKEYFARALHDSGPRRTAPFVAINCAAIPEHLIEAELFGYAPGAFTGARKDGSPGRLREAQGGTLFLDEIGDMPLALQTRLLRVLQERTVTPLGGARPVAVDFALICATHCKLREAAQQGRFRTDLYYRINGLAVHLPALRERTDFLALTQRLLSSLHADGPVQLAPDLEARMARHPWPGNLRQYASVLRTACAMLDPGETRLTWSHLPDDLLDELVQEAPGPGADALAAEPRNLEELSRSVIQRSLESCRGNVSQAARQLGISRQTLYRKLSTGRPAASPH